MKLKKLADQVVVITGATSGIGLVTARMAAKRGAKLVLVARTESALCSLAEELRESGAEAIYVKADVGVENDVKAVRDAASTEFRGFDTWVNNAAVSIYGKVTDVPIEFAFLATALGYALFRRVNLNGSSNSEAKGL